MYGPSQWSELTGKHLTAPVRGAALALLRVFVVALGLSGVAFSAGAARQQDPSGLISRRFANSLTRSGRSLRRAGFRALLSTALSPASPSIPRSWPARNRNPSSCVRFGTTSRAPCRLTASRAAATERAQKAFGSPGPKRLYGVDDAVILGVWGLETDFGGFVASRRFVRAPRKFSPMCRWRGNYFRDELLSALLILKRRRHSMP